MLFHLIKELNRLRKEISRLLSKEMSNIYLKITIEEKNWRSQKFDFLGWKICHHVNFRELQLKQVSLNFKTSCCNLKITGLGAKLCLVFLFFFIYLFCFSFWKELWCFKVKDPMHFVEQKYKQNEIKNGKSRVQF